MELRNSFLYSLKRTVPIAVGFFPVGMAYGLLMHNAGYNFIWSAFSSLFIYAGSLQILTVEFFSNDLSLFTVALTSLLLNSRHIFYGLSFIEKFRSYGFWKYFLIYGMSDENYSLLCSYKGKDGVSEKWVHIFSSALIWLYWILFSAFGGLLGQLITFNTEGVDFALTALFTVILIDRLKEEKSPLPFAISLLSSLIWIFIAGRDGFLLPSLITSAVLLMFFRKRTGEEKK